MRRSLRWSLWWVGIAGALMALGQNLEPLVNRVSDAPPTKVSMDVVRLHNASFVADLHADSLLWNRDLAKRSWIGHVDLPRLRIGNVALQVLTTVTRFPVTANISRTDPRFPDAITLLAVTNFWPPTTWVSLADRVLYQARKLDDLAAADPHLVRVLRRADLDRLVTARVSDADWIGVVLGIEGAHALDRPSALDEVYAAGVRLIGLAHFFDNDYAGSAHGVEKGGLTPAGRELLAAMQKRGIVVDLAHSSARTIDDVLSIADRPVVVSHTGVRATCDNERNLSDDQIRRIAAAGGVIGIGYWPTAVCGDDAGAIADAIVHAVKIAGVEHVALGSDFDGAVVTPFDASQLDFVTQRLVDAGLDDAAVKRVLGQNTLEVLRALLPE
jgi:microsomal dipeptidase-like Zn-dependent dipeptidase